MKPTIPPNDRFAPLPAFARPLTYAAIQARINEAPSEKEAVARESFEAIKGEPFSAHEWKEAKQNVLSLFGLLAEWKERT